MSFPVRQFRAGVPKAPSMAALAVLQSALSNLRVSHHARPMNQTIQRNASHQAQGRANKAKQGPGKRLGAKKTAGEYVVPGNILFKQRGTLWYPGDNCYMGRDHTIHAGSPGYVRYYRDPAHPKRKFIGIVFEKEQILPQPVHSARRRKLGLLAYEMANTVEVQESGDVQLSQQAPLISDEPNETRHQAVVTTLPPVQSAETGTISSSISEPKLRLRPGYQYRQGNWEIGRAAERAEAAAQARGTTTRTLPDFRRGKGIGQYRRKELVRQRKALSVPGAKKQKVKSKPKKGRK